MNEIMVITLLVCNGITNIILYDFFSTNYKMKYRGIYTRVFFGGTMIGATLLNLLHNPNFNLLFYIAVFVVLNYCIFELEKKKDIIININVINLRVLT